MNRAVCPRTRPATCGLFQTAGPTGLLFLRNVGQMMAQVWPPLLPEPDRAINTEHRALDHAAIDFRQAEILLTLGQHEAFGFRDALRFRAREAAELPAASQTTA